MLQLVFSTVAIVMVIALILLWYWWNNHLNMVRSRKIIDANSREEFELKSEMAHVRNEIERTKHLQVNEWNDEFYKLLWESKNGD